MVRSAPLCPVLQCCNCYLHISFLLISLAAQEAESIPTASLWAHFTLSSGWNCPSCFGPLSQSKIVPFYFSKNYKAFDPSEVLVAVFVASSVGSHSLGLLSSRPLSKWLTFVSVLAERAALGLNFTSLLSSSYCMRSFAHRHLFKGGSGATRCFHLFWHEGWSNWKSCLEFTIRTIAYQFRWPLVDFEWRLGALTICMGSRLCMKLLDMECSGHDLDSVKGNAALSKFQIETLGSLIQSISAATNCWAQPLYFYVLSFTSSYKSSFFSQITNFGSQPSAEMRTRTNTAYVCVFSERLKRSVPGPRWRRRPRHRTVPHPAVCLWNSLCSERAGLLDECCKWESVLQ